MPVGDATGKAAPSLGQVKPSCGPSGGGGAAWCGATAPNLLHELIHAVLPVDAGHGKLYKEAAIKIGLEGKMRHALPNQLLRPRLVALAESLGALPHARLNIDRGRDNRPADQPKKQRTRLLKAECGGEGCGYTVRITAKWVNDIGAPLCPKHGAMTVDRPEGDEVVEPVTESV